LSVVTPFSAGSSLSAVVDEATLAKSARFDGLELWVAEFKAKPGIITYGRMNEIQLKYNI
jgi:hypothetical protein